mmetsp:Transcript_148759/g.370642  ORF Transcript_148759/g.370642 Transcript_148759/m.370642 type:complete len:315 (+) Transcript_148759:156-1100(+)
MEPGWVCRSNFSRCASGLSAQATSRQNRLPIWVLKHTAEACEAGRGRCGLNACFAKPHLTPTGSPFRIVLNSCTRMPSKAKSLAIVERLDFCVDCIVALRVVIGVGPTTSAVKSAPYKLKLAEKQVLPPSGTLSRAYLQHLDWLRAHCCTLHIQVVCVQRASIQSHVAHHRHPSKRRDEGSTRAQIAAAAELRLQPWWVCGQWGLRNNCCECVGPHGFEVPSKWLCPLVLAENSWLRIVAHILTQGELQRRTNRLVIHGEEVVSVMRSRKSSVPCICEFCLCYEGVALDTYARFQPVAPTGIQRCFVNQLQGIC